MSMLNNRMINMEGRTLFKLKQSETYTVPDTITAASPTNASSGVSPTTVFDGKRATVGGAVYAAFNDGTGPTSLDIQFPLAPGDVILLSAVATNTITVTVNGNTVALVTGVTTTGGILGWIG